MSTPETKTHIPYEHPLSWKALGRVIAVAIVAYLSWNAIWIFVDILVAIMLATALYPLVEMVHKKLPFLLSIIVVIIGIILPFALLGIYVVPTVTSQLPQLLSAFYGVINHATFLPESIRSFDLIQYANQHTADLLASSPTIFFGIVSVLTVFFSMFYFILDHGQLTKLFLGFFPDRERPRIRTLLNKLALVNGQYIRGNLIISLICGAILLAGLLILSIPYAIPLALFAGLLDLLPLVGSTLGALPAVIIAFTISPVKGILVLVLHLAYQQTENAIISPAIYNKALNLSPALGFLSVVIGGGLFGIIGAFLALPVAASIPVLLDFAHAYSERNGS